MGLNILIKSFKLNIQQLRECVCVHIYLMLDNSFWFWP